MCVLCVSMCVRACAANVCVGGTLFISSSLPNTKQTQVIESQCVHFVCVCGQSVCLLLCKRVCRPLRGKLELPLKVVVSCKQVKIIA